MGYIYNFLACRGSRLPLAKRLFYFSLFTLSFFTSPVLAQDAFYIYRNDGDFDGFFYDEVIRMGYSKIDFNGFEHDQYVVQEVETKDSLYRIPLAVIDSIGFQQPEIIFNERVRNMDQLGITPYVKSWTNGWGARLEISKTIPANLLPQAGDILICDRDGYPFVKRVGGYSDYNPYLGESDDYYYIWLEAVEEIGEVIRQLITVEHIGVDEDGNVKRRIAGCNPDGTIRRGPLKAKTGDHEFCLLDLNGNIKREWSPKDNVNIDLAAEYSLKVKLKVSYNISWKRIFTKLDRTVEIGVTPSLGVSANTSFEAMVGNSSILPKALTSIKFPAACPIFQTSPLPDMFIRGGGSLTAKLSFPSVKFGLGECFTIDTDLPYFPLRYNMYKVPPSDEPSDDTIDSSASVALNGFLQMGIKMSGNIETNDWLDKFFSAYIGMDIYCGPKIEGTLQIQTPDNVTWGGSTWVYNNLKSSNLKLSLCSVDLEAKTRIFTFWHEDPEERVFFDGNMTFGDTTLAVVPTFKDVKIEYDYEKRVLSSSFNIENGVLVPNEVGVGIYKENEQNPTSTVFNPEKYSFIHPFKEFHNTWDLNDFEPGTYRAAPVVSLFGITVAAPFFQRFHVTHHLELDEQELAFSGKDETKEIHVTKTTCNELRYTFPDEYRGETPAWITVEVNENKSISISVKANQSFKKRQAKIRIVTRDLSNSNIVASKDVVITQDFCPKSCTVYFNSTIPTGPESDYYTHPDISRSVSMPCSIEKIDEKTIHLYGTQEIVNATFPYLGNRYPYAHALNGERSLDLRIDVGGEKPQIISGNYTQTMSGVDKNSNGTPTSDLLSTINIRFSEAEASNKELTKYSGSKIDYVQDYYKANIYKKDGTINNTIEKDWGLREEADLQNYISISVSDISMEELKQ